MIRITIDCADHQNYRNNFIFPPQCKSVNFHISKSSFTRMFICTQFIDQLPVGLLAQLVERCTGIAEVMGSNPVRAWNFFQVLLTTTSFSSVLSWEDLLISSFHHSANLWIFIYLNLHSLGVYFIIIFIF